jgi:transposase
MDAGSPIGAPMDTPKPKPPTYTAAPTMKPDLLPRYELILQVLGGRLTVSEAARQAGMARNQFQTLMHRAQQGLIDGMTPKAPGRPPMPERERQLEQTVQKLEQQNEALKQELTEQRLLLTVASQMIRDRASTVRASVRRLHRPRAKTTPVPAKDKPESPEDDVDQRLEHAQALRRGGLRAPLVAALVGVSAATLRRWERRRRRGQAPAARRGPAPGRRQVEPAARDRVDELVRVSGGVLSADALRRQVPGVSRRQALGIKRETLTEMERERKAACARVVITEPGVLRGFDAVHARTSEQGRCYALCSGDGCVPYGTSIAVVEDYDAPSVALALDADFCTHGAPLVVRLDRASVHQAPVVKEVCAGHGVLMLHGPPHHPCFYGQLERQNRERRALLELVPCRSLDDVASQLESQRVLLNNEWRRRSLDWNTAAENWAARKTPCYNRTALRAEVADLNSRIARQLGERAYRGLAERLAIETALKRLGLLRVERTGGLLGN